MQDIITDQRGPRILVKAVRERLGRLTADQLEAGMVFLSGHDPELFDTVIRRAQVWDDGTAAGTDALT